MPVLTFVLALVCLLVSVSSKPATARPVETVKPLNVRAPEDVRSLLPDGTLLLDDPPAIEEFLKALDGKPPDWKELYGRGDDEHMDRLFTLNRERDRLREGKAALTTRVTFVWEAVVSGYERESGGFRLAIGPRIIPTTWGQVRFKPYGLPSGLVAVPTPRDRKRLRDRLAREETIDVNL